MDLTITLQHDELIDAVRRFLPMRLLLGVLEGNGDPAWVQVDKVHAATFLPRRGLAVRFAACVHYPLPIMPDDFEILDASLEMVPSIVDGPDGPRLEFALEIADLDLKFLPDWIDRAIAKKLNTALRTHASVIAWDFTKSLSRIVHLPKRFELVRGLELGPPQGLVSVGDDSIVVRIAFAVAFHHDIADAQRAP
jgi:hypothetical protein